MIALRLMPPPSNGNTALNLGWSPRTKEVVLAENLGKLSIFR
jgi:hypothetical protein